MNVKGIGPVQTNRLLLSIEEKDTVLKIEQEILNFLTGEQKKLFTDNALSLDCYRTNNNIGFISILDNDYPEELKRYLSIRTPPILSYMGNITLLKKKKIGISGSRSTSEKGINITKDCVSQLTQRDICIVSGYASGVDQISHQTAIMKGGSTIVVLSEGIDKFKIKQELKDIWDWNRVLIISEFSPDAKWSVGNAMSRNNSIVGLSDIMIVIEAGEKGGSLDAGLKCLQQGKALFVPKYEVPPISAFGNNSLIAKGAFPIMMKKQTEKANLSKIFEFLDEENKYTLFPIR